ncbi:putative acid phosphatase [Frankia canadensis]|uniref:5'-nucleotidase n=1 Tax=Frankia canadensis TaxID=1836972 RepID=A0A2I2KRU8_9ACTN|nr:5'/3'-nucleotidase SurE [Frankia canadensis]SNQ48393.1 putative acid phosphatase [Frankia canadensis]SOU55683.1 putative acid phosphatase [Frankia canadensis]
MKKRRIPVVLGVAILSSLVGITSSASAAGPGTPTPAPARPLHILLTNDDGWRGAGGSDTPLIVALRDSLKAAGHDVVVVAPGTDQSGQGGRFSIPPLQLTVARPEPSVWTVASGSPSDSVFFAFDQLYRNTKPDLVISGINPGNNLGQAVNHSGTVNAALTALEFGVPAIAVSMQTSSAWREGTAVAAKSSAGYVVDLVHQLEGKSQHGVLMPPGVGLNVNYPVLAGPVDPATGKPGSALPPKGVRSTALDTNVALDLTYTPTSGQAGQPGTYTIGLTPNDQPAPAGTDTRAIQDGFVSLTPLEADRDVDGSTEGWLRRIL